MTEIIIPKLAQNTGTAFYKHSKTAVDFALVNGAALVTLDGNTVTDARFSVGAIHTPPIRLPQAEKLLVGSSITDELLAAVAAQVAQDVSPDKDARASDEYLRHCAGVVITRCIKRAADRATGGAE